MKQLALLLTLGVVLLGQGSSIPTQAKDIATPSAPPSGYTKVYTKGGKICSENSSAAENCTGAAASGVTSIIAGTGISVNAATGAVTVTNTSSTNCPAGSAGDVQYYVSAGVCGGNAGFARDLVTGAVNIGGLPIVPLVGAGLYTGPDEGMLPAALRGYVTSANLFTQTGIVNVDTIGIETDSAVGIGLYSVLLGAGPSIESDLLVGSSGGQPPVNVNLFADANGFMVGTLVNLNLATILLDMGTINTAIALNIEDQTLASTNFAIKTGLGKNYLGDTLQAQGYLSADASVGTTGNGFKNGLCVTASGACVGGAPVPAGTTTADEQCWASASTFGVCANTTISGRATEGSATLTADVVNPFIQAKNTQAATAPGAAKCDVRVIAGTNAGTGKIVINCGTSATEVTIADNIGAAF